MRYGRVLLLLTLFLAWALPAQAAAPVSAPADYQPFSRDAWGLTLAHPPDWKLIMDQEDAVMFGWQGGGGDMAAIIVARDPAWRSRAYSLQALMADVNDKLKGEMGETRQGPAPGQVVAGALARAGIVYFMDPNTKRDVAAHVFQLARNGVGYGIVEAAFADTWADHEPEFDAMLASIRIDVVAEPTATPTPGG
jgi:hypothetical protein